MLTRRTVHFETELRREELLKQRAAADTPEAGKGGSLPEHPSSELEQKRHAEQRERDEKSRRLRETKKAYKQADIHFSKGAYGIAEKHLLQVLSYDNDHLDANLKLGLLYLHQENLPRAEFFFQKLIDLKENPVYFSNLALTLFQQNRFEESAQLYERAIVLDPKKASRFVSLAYVYKELGELERALAQFEEAARLEPRNIDLLWTLVEFYEKFSRKEEMARILRKILEIDPYNTNAKGRLVLIEEEMAPLNEPTSTQESPPSPAKNPLE